jgi:hypothetical protein
MNAFCGSLALLLAGTLIHATVAQSHPRQAQEQTAFSAEDEGVRKPVPVPKDILSLLAQDEFVRNAMEYSGSPMKTPPQKWFSASVVHLGSPNENDLIIQARGPLMGANIDTFWVFLGKPTGHVLVATAPVHNLRVLKTRWGGYREIELFSATAVECSTVILRHNGAKYEEYSEKSGPIPDC